MLFRDLSLHEKLLENIEKMGFEAPTSIQGQVIPIGIEGKDLSGLSRTGTGKTAAFLIPVIHRLASLPPDTISLCLAPTRELAVQIQQEADRLAQGMNISSVCVVGGMSSEDQMKQLRSGARLVIGTPGRVIDLYKERALDLSRVEVLVFDEADRMFDMGFIKDMRYILAKVNPKRQILLFSATMNFSVLNMVYEYGAHPEEINVSRDQMTAENIQQLLYHIGDREKASALLTVCRKHAGESGSIIVFVNYKEKVLWVASLLSRNGIPAQGLSSMLRQERRNRIIHDFKAGKFRALVATDVASRGLDVDDISLVVNYHLPEDAATYVHRIGRTARAGRSGLAVSICSSEDAYNQIRVEEFLGHKIPVEWLGEEEMIKELKLPSRKDVEAEENEEEGASMGDENQTQNQEPSPHRERQHDRRGNRGNDRHQNSPRRTDERESRHGRNDGRRGRDRHGRRDRPERRRHEPEQAMPKPADLPSPLTGNPIIYCMKTGKPKNRSTEEFKLVIDNYDRRLESATHKFASKPKAGPAIIKKITSKVSALFGNKSK